MTWTVRTAAKIAAARRCWMTREEFERVWRANFHRARIRAGGAEAVGISTAIAQRIIAGERTVRKAEALAIAHYLLGFPMPVPAGDVAAFNLWFRLSFGEESGAVTTWLGLPESARVADYMRGFMMFRGQQVPRLPGVTIIRALAWVDHSGPFVPFGCRDLEGTQ